MSRMWKIIIGVIVVVIVVAGIAAWFFVGRGLSPIAFAQRPEGGPQLEVRLVDDNEDGVPDRGVIDLPAGPAFGRGFGPGRGLDRDQPGAGPGPGAGAGQLEVRLVDDDEDGVPDRGVLNLPRGRPFERDFGPGRGSNFGRGFEPGFGSRFGPGFGRGFGSPIWPFFSPFFLVGGLIRLAVLALLVVLIIFFIRRWRSSPPSTPANTQAGDS